MSVGSPSRFHGTNLISVVAALALIGIAATSAETALLNYQLRARIAKAAAQAESAASLVAANATLGRHLDSGWRPADQPTAGEHIAISRETGIVTVTLAGETGGKLGNLKLVPISDGGFVKLTDGQVGGQIDWTKVKWVCTSRDTRYSFAVPSYGYGSLPSRLAPAECR